MTCSEQEGSKKADKDARSNEGHIPGCRSVDMLGVELGDQEPDPNTSRQRPPTETHQRSEQRRHHTRLDLAVPQIGKALLPIEQGEERETSAQSNPQRGRVGGEQ